MVRVVCLWSSIIPPSFIYWLGTRCWRGETLALTSGSFYQLEKSGETNFHTYFWTLDILPLTLDILFWTLDILPSTLDILPSTLDPRQKPTLIAMTLHKTVFSPAAVTARAINRKFRFKRNSPVLFSVSTNFVFKDWSFWCLNHLFTPYRTGDIIFLWLPWHYTRRCFALRRVLLLTETFSSFASIAEQYSARQNKFDHKLCL